MIYYVSLRQHAYTQAVLLLYHRPDLNDILRLLPYDQVGHLRDLEAGTVIWTDMDRLDPGDVARHGELADWLAAHRPSVRQLNHPARSLQRFELLRTLREAGVNAFSVHRPDALPESIRYPVFIRDEVGALYRPPPLLSDRAALEAALQDPVIKSMKRPMIAELSVSRHSDGLYRKYAAYRVGETIYPQHCFADTQWFVKHPHARLPQHARAVHYDFVAQNPHARELMPIFEQASIEYGRIDYDLVEERIRVFEINTNPTILSEPPTRFDSYDSRIYADRHASALLDLPGAGDTAATPGLDRIHDEVIRNLRRKYRRKRAKLTLRRIAARLAGRS